MSFLKTSDATNKNIMSILAVNVFQFLFVLLIVGSEAEIPKISTHSCPKAAFIYKFNGYIYDGDAASVPKKTFIAKSNQNAYTYSLDDSRFSVGQTLYIRALIPQNTEAISINLLSNTPVLNLNEGQTALHMRIMINDGKIFYNSVQGGHWGQHREEPLPSIRYDTPFDIRIRALSDRFEISFNGRKHTDFEYRIPLDIVDGVSIEGDAQLSEIHLGGPMPDNIQQIDMPDGPWKDGERIRVTGITYSDVFEINVLDVNGFSAFHFSPRFDGGYVIRSTQFSRFMWDKKELIGAMPFRKGVEFLVEFVKNAWGIEIYVNHVYSYTYKHRISNADVGYTAIRFSDVVVHEFEICTTKK